MSPPPPPPPYAEVPSYPAPTLSTLPLPLLDRIMAHLTGPTSADPALASTKAERACRLWWVCREVRTVSRPLYLVAQRRLRGLLLPSYLAQIRTPFGSSLSPETLVGASVSVEGLLFPEATHELAILDLYIAAYLRERAEAAESAGFGEAANWREDLFVLYQPQARLFELLLASPYLPPLPFPLKNLALRFTPRRVSLARILGGSKRRELVAFTRVRGETEKDSVAKLVQGLEGLAGELLLEG